MKTDIHPKNYRPVVFQDSNDSSTILTRSTAEAEETITLDGVEYPLVKVHISSSSHPYFTGEERIPWALLTVPSPSKPTRPS